MHIAESRIIGLNIAHDGSDRVDVMIDRVLVSPGAARGLAVGDCVSLNVADPVPNVSTAGEMSQEYICNPATPPVRPESPAYFGRAPSNPDALAKELHRQKVAGVYTGGMNPSNSPEFCAMIDRERGQFLERHAARPEVPAFQAAADHEIGVGYLKGVTYQYAYPKGAMPADACRWSHIDETGVREELWDIQTGDIVYDIGSAFGSYALCALAMGAAHVVCFNPNPQEQDLLMASARLNGWENKITRRNVGLWSENGYLNDEEQTFTKAGGGFKVTKTADGRHTQMFEVQSLDSMMLTPVIPGRRVIKMDVEGAEVEVLRGARVFFAQHEPAFVLIEVHLFKKASLEQETDAAMDELGYVPVTKRPYHSVMHALYRMKGWDD